jgi:uracil-DNA glycosylase family 4
MHELDEEIRVCVKCPLHTGRTHAVPGEGPVPADVFILGEAPGAREDHLGRPFVGPSGMLLKGLLEIAGLTRDDVYITSCVKCRPPNNRTPRTLELGTCQGNWLNRQVDLVNPGLIVLLGKVAINQLIGVEGNMRDLHGQTIERDERLYLMTYHPAAAFRVPETKNSMEQDMLTLRQLLVKA